MGPDAFDGQQHVIEAARAVGRDQKHRRPEKHREVRDGCARGQRHEPSAGAFDEHGTPACAMVFEPEAQRREVHLAAVKPRREERRQGVLNQSGLAASCENSSSAAAQSAATSRNASGDSRNPG